MWEFISRGNYRIIDQKEQREIAILLNSIFSTCLEEPKETSHYSSCEFITLCSSLSILCKGTRNEKIGACFRLYSYSPSSNHNSTLHPHVMGTHGCVTDKYSLSRVDLRNYLISVFKMLYLFKLETTLQMAAISPLELAIATMEQVFLETHSSQHIDLNDCMEWFDKDE